MNYVTLNNELTEKGVKLVAVSKTHPIEIIKELHTFGHRDFGENKVQELTEKAKILPTDIRWHMIGHLQRNKVKHIVPFVHMIHSVDSQRLLREINKEAAKIGRTINCLLQVKIAREDSKFGFYPQDVENLIDSEEFKSYNNVRIAGLMGMATNTNDKREVSREFHQLKTLFDSLKSSHFADYSYFKELSMGMSGDYELAVEEGKYNGTYWQFDIWKSSLCKAVIL